MIYNYSFDNIITIFISDDDEVDICLDDVFFSSPISSSYSFSLYRLIV